MEREECVQEHRSSSAADTRANALTLERQRFLHRYRKSFSTHTHTHTQDFNENMRRAEEEEERGGEERTPVNKSSFT